MSAAPAAAPAKKPANSKYVPKAQRTRNVRKEQSAQAEEAMQPGDGDVRVGKLAKRITELMGGQMSLDALRVTYKAEKVKDKQDGMLSTALAQHRLSRRELNFVFDCIIGSQRYDRLFKSNATLVKKDGRFTDEEHERAENAIRAWSSEHGLACKHKEQREYLESEDFITKYAAYKEGETEADRRPLGWERFYVLITKIRPMLRTSRLRQDCCDACLRIENQLQTVEDMLANDTRLTVEQRQELLCTKGELLMEQKSHSEVSEGQRRAMNSYIKKYFDQWENEEPPIAWPPVLEDLPEVEIGFERESVPRLLHARKVLVRCEDYG
jgi:hypothetical protein